MAALASTIAIILIIVLFALASSLFSAKAGIKKSTEDFSASAQAEESLLSLLQSSHDNKTVSDMIRISRVDSSYDKDIESQISILNNVYQTWGIDAEGILIGDLTAFRDGITARIRIPNYEKPINVAFGVKNE